MKEEKDLIDILIKEWKEERPQLDTSAIQVVGRILNLSKILEKRTSIVLEEYGIHYTDFDVLATIRRSGTPYELTPSNLMKSVLITSGAMTALLKRLSGLGLIYRAQDAKDGRIKLVGLTKKGAEIIDRATETRFMEATESIKILNNTENQDLSSLLKKILISFNP